MYNVTSAQHVMHNCTIFDSLIGLFVTNISQQIFGGESLPIPTVTTANAIWPYYYMVEWPYIITLEWRTLAVGMASPRCVRMADPGNGGLLPFGISLKHCFSCPHHEICVPKITARQKKNSAAARNLFFGGVTRFSAGGGIRRLLGLVTTGGAAAIWCLPNASTVYTPVCFFNPICL